MKGIHFEGLRVVGKPHDMAKRYSADSDEILFIDTVASLYGRDQLTPLLESTVHDVFVPITVGGGIKSKADVRRLLHAGADKVAINTAAIRNPEILSDIANTVGSQAVVVSIEAKRVNDGWEAYTDNGRERTGKDAVRWAFEAVERGAGEILLTSIDQEGTRRGFDLLLASAIAPKVPVPVTLCGGMGTIEHALEALEAGADAIAMASVLHYNQLTMRQIQDGVADKRQRRTHASHAGHAST